MTTLISFLGKGRYEKDGYRTARYRFDPSFVREVPFFGMALDDYLKPDRLILVGTSGSMWDVFFEREASQNDESLLELIDAVESNAVAASMLRTHATRLAERLGHPVDCVLIDYARDETGQAALLGQLAAHLNEGEHIAIDVTHAFRHLPMLALIAARFLARVRNVRIEDIYYGAYDMKDETSGDVPVLRLKGMLRMLDWVDALSSYDKDGDYSVFSTLLAEDGMPEGRARILESAAFQERVNHIEGARQKLSASLDAIANHEGPVGRLFRPELEARVAWVRKPERSQRELALADAYLARRDYLRSTIFLLEGLITREVDRRRGIANNFKEREEASKALGQDNKRFKKLEWLRNALAHGQRSQDDETAKLLAEESALRDALKRFIRELVA
ncbi:MAG: TIGR02221 family CRISPR-associated protein [Betaproteobacteria bacterium]|nr:MAG: TIGR02221 family CRISPR-associated protein [Betaproteobacteria bacterium]